ncbi:MAG: hypothetical protein ABSF22_06535 [Bryobacteraceae bacterium]
MRFTDVIFLAKQNRWQCRNKHSQRQFSLKMGTIYEDSPLGLDKWLVATWLVVNCKNGASSCEVAWALNITQKVCPGPNWVISDIGKWPGVAFLEAWGVSRALVQSSDRGHEPEVRS